MVKARLLKTFFIQVVFVVQGFSKDALSLDQIRKAYFDSYQLESKERYVEAIRALDPVQDAYGNTYTVNYRTGWLYFKNKSWSEAIRFYDKALAVAPSSLEAYNGIINVYAAEQDWKSVAEQCKRVLQIDYENSIANDWQINAEMALGDRDAAKKNTYRMLALYPTSIYFLIDLGKIQYANKEYAGAAETFTSVQILDPYNQTASYYLGLLLPPKK